MGSNRAAWLVSLPVALAGCLAAHVAAYALATPAAHAHDAHRYLEQLPLLAGASLAVVLGAAVRHAVGGRPGAGPSPWLFALVPPLAFAIQEHLETLPGAALVVAEPTFLLGLALQVPFAALAWVLARAILRAAEALGALLRPAPARHPVLAVQLRPAVLALTGRPVTSGRSQRGPPLAVATRS